MPCQRIDRFARLDGSHCSLGRFIDVRALSNWPTERLADAVRSDASQVKIPIYSIKVCKLEPSARRPPSGSAVFAYWQLSRVASASMSANSGRLHRQNLFVDLFGVAVQF